VDSEDHLAALVISADPDALRDLRARVLAPLNGMRPATRERLEATLRSWLLHQGRREAVAAELHVHPQTVRYRMSQLRDLYGDQLDDPATIFDLLLALPNHTSSD
jgi:DNA-binding PucR family transcriptional regulator